MTDKGPKVLILIWTIILLMLATSFIVASYVLVKDAYGYESAWLYYNQGNAHYEEGKFDEAIEDYKKAIGIESEFTEAYNNLGNAYGRKGDYDNAIANYTRAVNISPRFGKAYVNLGYAYYLKGNYKLSCRYYERACGLGYCKGLGWVNSQDLCD